MPNGNLNILVDADSCPVKQEIFKVALRHQAKVKIVSNSYIKIPANSLFESVMVNADFDAADNYIVEYSSKDTIVITSDILLANRCLKAAATVVAPNGKQFTNNSIGTAIATRAIFEDLRAGGEQHGGPLPFSKADRSRFLATLHETIVSLKKN